MKAHMNYVRKSTVGFSIGSILLDMMGAHLSIFQMFLLAYNNGKNYCLVLLTIMVFKSLMIILNFQ